MEESHLKVDRLLRDHKSKEKEKCREIIEELKRVHEGGGVSLEVESKREDITTDLDEMKRSSEVRGRGRYVYPLRCKSMCWVQSFGGLLILALLHLPL